MWGAEADIRSLARRWKNSYHISVFACCREVYNPNIHSGGFIGTYKDAVKFFASESEQQRFAEEKKEFDRKELQRL